MRLTLYRHRLYDSHSKKQLYRTKLLLRKWCNEEGKQGQGSDAESPGFRRLQGEVGRRGRAGSALDYQLSGGHVARFVGRRTARQAKPLSTAEAEIRPRATRLHVQVPKSGTTRLYEVGNEESSAEAMIR